MARAVCWRELETWQSAPAPVPELVRELLGCGIEAGRRAALLRVPGRIELLGKHTDYAGGRSLLAAIDRGLTLVVCPRSDQVLHWRDVGRRVDCRFGLEDPGGRPGHWSNYLRAAAKRLVRDAGLPRRGADVAMTSDLPAASGLSSSSALVVAFFQVLDAVSPLRANLRFEGADDSCERLAGYLGAMENGSEYLGLAGDDGVGTLGGGEDHCAILCSRAGRLRRVRFRPARLEQDIAMPRQWTFAIGVSGVHAKKTGGALESFNRLARLAAEAASPWSRELGAGVHLGAALEACRGDSIRVCEAIERELPGRVDVLERARHFCRESEVLVPRASHALEQGDLGAFADAANESHHLGAELLRNQVPETMTLAREALSAGALTASSFGAGFGGAVWALVPRSEVATFAGDWRERYRAAHPDSASAGNFFHTDPSAGARWVESISEETP